MHISPLFIGLFAIVQVPVTVAVGYRRAQTNIHFGGEGDTVLLRRMRAHGNFVETVPMTLLAMAAAEVMGAPPSLLIAAGVALACGRVLHYATLVRSAFGTGRAAGMVLTLLSMGSLGGWVLVKSASVLG